MDKNKLIKLIIIIVIIIALVLGFYKLFSLADKSENANTAIKKTTSSEETWSTYEDTENGVSFEYPLSWERQVLDGGIVGFARKDGTNVTFMVEDLSENPVTLDEYTEAALAGLDALELDIEILESKDITRGELPAHTLTYTAAGDEFTTKIEQNWVLKNNKAYIISFTAEAGTYRDVSAIGDTILQSLQVK